MVLLLTLGAIGIQKQSGFRTQSDAVDKPIAKQDSPSASKIPKQPMLAKTIANDPEFLAARLEIAQEHQARLELIVLRTRNVMNSPSVTIDPSLIAHLHSEAWQTVEMPDVSEILSGKHTTAPLIHPITN